MLHCSPTPTHTYLLLADTVVAVVGIVLQIVAVLRNGEERTARGIQGYAPLYGIQQKQLRPGLLQQYDLIPKR